MCRQVSEIRPCGHFACTHFYFCENASIMRNGRATPANCGKVPPEDIIPNDTFCVACQKETRSIEVHCQQMANTRKQEREAAAAAKKKADEGKMAGYGAAKAFNLRLVNVRSDQFFMVMDNNGHRYHEPIYRINGMRGEWKKEYGGTLIFFRTDAPRINPPSAKKVVSFRPDIPKVVNLRPINPRDDDVFLIIDQNGHQYCDFISRIDEMRGKWKMDNGLYFARTDAPIINP